MGKAERRNLETEAETSETMPTPVSAPQPSSVSATLDFNSNEARTYGGIQARILAPLADHLISLRARSGVAAYHKVFCHLSSPLRHALFVYSRVKQLLRTLVTPQTINVSVSQGGLYIRMPRRGSRVRREQTTDTPDRALSWTSLTRLFGSNVRGSSLDGIATRVSELRANARRRARTQFMKEREIFVMARRAPISKHRRDPVTDTPHPDGSACADIIFGEVWPPVSLTRSQVPDVKVQPVITKLGRPDQQVTAQHAGAVEHFEPCLGYAMDYLGFCEGDLAPSLGPQTDQTNHWVEVRKTGRGFGTACRDGPPRLSIH